MITSAPLAPTPSTSAPRTVVDAYTKTKPKTVDLLTDWQYLEKSVHRLLCAWGRHLAEWDDKSALHRHVWEQSEIVRRLRVRIDEFPGGKPDAPVSSRWEELVNAVLLAPGLDDALDGIHLLLGKALVTAYVDYAENAHPVHDAPTISMLHEINQIKASQWLWYRDYRRRNKHTTDATYKQRILDLIMDLGSLHVSLPVDGAEAQPVGVNTDFRLPKFSNRNAPVKPEHDYMPYVTADFSTNLEARRLFWAVAYMREMNLPDNQLAWLYYGADMPWEWHSDISRHLWDESRHGQSGYSRMLDFGISLEEVGFTAYNQDELLEALQEMGAEGRDFDPRLMDIMMEPMSPKDLYEAIFFIGMVAENGHFIVKNEAYKDFQEGKDMESAEMMLFDIIDETTHVQYAHRWLPLLAEKAGISNEGYRERAAQERAKAETRIIQSIAETELSRDPADPAFAFYQALLERIRQVMPPDNATSCQQRSQMPM